MKKPKFKKKFKTENKGALLKILITSFCIMALTFGTFFFSVGRIINIIRVLILVASNIFTLVYSILCIQKNNKKALAFAIIALVISSLLFIFWISSLILAIIKTSLP